MYLEKKNIVIFNNEYIIMCISIITKQYHKTRIIKPELKLRITSYSYIDIYIDWKKFKSQKN